MSKKQEFKEISLKLWDRFFGNQELINQAIELINNMSQDELRSVESRDDPLPLVIANQQVLLLEAIIEKGKINPNIINSLASSGDLEGNNLLHYALQFDPHDKYETLKKLIKDGGDPSIPNIDGKKPVHAMMEFMEGNYSYGVFVPEKPDFFKFIVENSGDLNLPYQKEDPYDNWKKKPITIQGHAIEVINVCDSKSEMRTEIVKILVAQGMNIWDISAKLANIRGIGLPMEALKLLFAATKVIDKISKNEPLSENDSVDKLTDSDYEICLGRFKNNMKASGITNFEGK